MLGLQIGQLNSFTWYELDEQPVTFQSMLSNSNKQFKLIIKLASETAHHSRSIYSGLDMLGDVGGLLDGLKLLGSGVIFLFNLIRGDPLQAFLMRSIFRKGTREESKEVDLSQGMLQIAWRRPFESKTCLCSKSKKERRLQRKGWDRIEKALDI